MAAVSAIRQPLAADERLPSGVGVGIGNLAGLAGLGFVGLVVAENVLRGGAPMGIVDAAAISSYYVERRVPIAISQSMVVVALPLLLIFANAVFRRLRAGSGGDFWPGIGLGGAHVLAALFVLVSATDLALNAIAGRVSGSPDVLIMLHALHGAAFVFNMAVLGVTFGGFGLGAWQARSEPRWLAAIGIGGGALLLLGALPALAVVEGSYWIGIGLVGFLGWLFWMVAMSIRMLRTS